MPNAYAFTIHSLFKTIMYCMQSFFLFGIIRTDVIWRKVLLFNDVNIYAQPTMQID